MDCSTLDVPGMLGPKRRTPFVFDVSSDGQHGWRMKTDRDGRFYSHSDLADWAAKCLIDRTETERKKKR